VRGNLPLGAELRAWPTLEGVNYEIREGAGEPRGSIYGGGDRERGSNRATGEGYREGLRLGGDPIRREGEGERVSNQDLLKALQEAGILQIIPVGSYEEKGEKSE
jgi:hypothetical protein